MNITVTDPLLHHFGTPISSDNGMQPKEVEKYQPVEPEQLLTKSQANWLKRGERMGCLIRQHARAK